jgi:argininosuccinate lyase
MQEDKPPVFHAADTVKSSLAIFTDMLDTLHIKKDTMAQAAKKGYMNATDAADYLVGKGLAFRDCHEVIGKMVLYCIYENKAIEDLTLTELKNFSEKFEEDVYDKISVTACIEAKKSQGSTSFDSVAAQIATAEKELQA